MVSHLYMANLPATQSYDRSVRLRTLLYGNINTDGRYVNGLGMIRASLGMNGARQLNFLTQ